MAIKNVNKCSIAAKEVTIVLCLTQLSNNLRPKTLKVLYLCPRALEDDHSNFSCFYHDKRKEHIQAHLP